jgi:hypothetical protein
MQSGNLIIVLFGLNRARIFQSALLIVLWRCGPLSIPQSLLVFNIRISFLFYSGDVVHGAQVEIQGGLENVVQEEEE